MTYIYTYMSLSQNNISLNRLDVNIEDSSFLSSDYFVISNFDGNFGLGKNVVTINNPPKDIKIEAYDANENLLFYENSIEDDIVNKTQILTFSFHVTTKNINGIGKLYIVGTFSNKIVRYSANLNINTNTITNSKVLFYKNPQIEVSPLLTFVAKTNTAEANPKTSIGTFYSKAIYPPVNFNIDEIKYNKSFTDYQLTSKNSIFSSSFKNFYAKLYVNKIKNPLNGQELIVNDTASILIKNVINKQILQLESPYTYKNPVNNKNSVAEIIDGTYKILYSEYDYNPSYFTAASYLTESVDFAGNVRLKRNSIAEITYRNIDTFSGNIASHKIYRRSLNIPEDYTTIVDAAFEPYEYLKNSIIPIKSYQNLGNFYAQDFINNFWFTSSNNINLLSDSNHYIDGLKITGSSINNGYIIVKLNTSNLNRNSSYIAYNENEYTNQSGSSYDSNFIKLLKDTSYTLSFNCNLLNKNINDDAELSFYLTGSYISNKQEPVYNTTYGILLANIQIKDAVNSKNFLNTLKFKYKPLNDLYGTLVIVPRKLNTIVLNNISIQQEKAQGFNYNSYTIRVPFRVDQPNELFDIKAELYDANSNLVYSNLRTIQAFDPDGKSSPVNNFNTSTISTGVLNVSSETNLTGSINVDNFGCTPETDINNVKYVVTWDNVSKNLCVATSSLFITSGSGGGTGSTLTTGSTYPITSSWAQSASNAINSQTASFLPVNTYDITSSWSINSLTASSINFTASNAVLSRTSSYILASNVDGTVNSASYALTASHVPNLTINKIISTDANTFFTTTNNFISSSISNVPSLLINTQSLINDQNNSSSFLLYGRYSGSNINVGVPNNNYPWGNSLTGSYFSTWTTDTNVSDVLRFFAGAFSSSYPIPTANTRTYSSVSGTNTNFGSAVTINGRVPSGSTNPNILYLQPLGWAIIGSTIFSGFTFNSGSAYVLYSSIVGGTTTVSSSLGANSFGLGQLTSGNITQVNLSGSFRLTFASSSAGTINYIDTSSILLSQSVINLTSTVSNPIAINTIPSANTAVIPSVFQDGFYNNFTGSNLTNSVSLSNLSSSGIYVFSASIGMNSGSSPYTTRIATPVTYNYTPLKDSDFTQTISSPNSSASYVTVITRSLSGAPYLTSGSSYRYVATASNAFNPLYFNGTVATVNFTNTTLGLVTVNSSSLVTNPTIQTAGVVRSSDYSTIRAVGTHPFESDVVVFDLILGAAGTGSNAVSSSASFSTFTSSITAFNRAGTGTVIGSQTYNVHVSGSFGIPIASGSLLYFGRPDGFVTSSLTFGSQSLTPAANREQLLDESNRIVLNDNMLTMTGTGFNSASILGNSELQVKPGFIVNPGGIYGYWYPNAYGTTYKYYVRRFRTTVVVNRLRITITGNTTLVNWDSTASNSIAMAILFESGNANVYSRCRLYDVNNLVNNVISSSVASSNLNTSGVNPFGSLIDLYGNNGLGASVSSGVIIFPTRAADGAILDNTNAAQDDLYLLVRYNGNPAPITSITIEKLS